MRAFKFDLDKGRGTFLPRQGAPVDLAGIKSAVKHAGFELLWLEAEVRGVLVAQAKADGTLGVRVKETGQVFSLHQGRTEPEQASYARLRDGLAQKARPIIVRGRAAQSSGMVLSSFRWARG